MPQAITTTPCTALRVVYSCVWVKVQLQYKFNVVATNDETAVTLEHDGASARLKSELKRQPAQPSNPFVHEEYDDIDPQLNLHYTFDNYCDSPCNKLAVTIGKAIADHPGGLGIFLVKQVMDEVSYERIDDRNVLTLSKTVAPHSG